MSSSQSITANNITKTYKIYNQPEDRLKQSIVPRIQKILRRPQSRYFSEFTALSNINFEILKGETVGIVGKNGSGKSTLLQIVCGTLTPNTGVVQTKGRIAALLELGSGFNPEFTGRENIYLNGAILGLKKEKIDEYFDAIAAFADIGDFLDRPVKTYSSGMGVRLAFAVQAQIEPDILIVDEALAVGDAKFQIKCFNHLKKLKENGTSILLVTHSTEQIVSHCDRAILLDGGEIQIEGEPRTVVNRYLDILFGRERAKVNKINTPLPTTIKSIEEDNDRIGISTELEKGSSNFSKRPNYNNHEHRWGDGSAEIVDFNFFSDKEQYPISIPTGTTINLWFSVQFHLEIVSPIYGITIKTKEGITVYGKNTLTEPDNANLEAGRAGSTSIIRAQFDAFLASGDYFISIGVASNNGEAIIPHDRRYDSIHFQIAPDNDFHGIANLRIKIDSDNLKNAE